MRQPLTPKQCLDRHEGVKGVCDVDSYFVSYCGRFRSFWLFEWYYFLRGDGDSCVRSNDCNAGLVCERGLCTAEQQLNFTNTDGSADGTSDGNTDGSNTGSADGSGDGSGNGNTDGSSNGNTDGSSGSSDGSTDGSTDGGGSMGESAVCITDLFNIYGQGDCDDGFICLPDTPDSFLGRCRTSCGVPNADFVLGGRPLYAAWVLPVKPCYRIPTTSSPTPSLTGCTRWFV